jgi:molybdopterin-synthase adenylyltransferase
MMERPRDGQEAATLAVTTKLDAKLRERYSRQILFGGIGEEGQSRLRDSSAVVVGCGALGTALSNLLVRAGIGRLRIVDRDFVEPSNLQRQMLFEEDDARAALPKAVAAQRRLAAINSEVQLEGIVADLTPGNIDEMLGEFPLLLDGTDNFETRLLLNDYAITRSLPWVYAAAVSSYGVTMTIRPGETACLACLAEHGDASNREGAFGAPGSPANASAGPENAVGIEPTCDTVGILGTVVGVTASIQATSAIKLLIGKYQPGDDRLVSYDVWSGRYQAIRVARRLDCRACVRREFRYLQGQAQPHLTLCGRDSVQIHERRRRLDLLALGRTLAASGSDVRQNEFLLRLSVPPYELTIFADGRAIVRGTHDPAVARSLYARYIGS